MTICAPGWTGWVGACDLNDLVRDEDLLDSPASDLASPAHSTPSLPSSRRRARTLSLCPDCSRRSATLRPSTPHKSF
eukprot:1095865-Pleurochrysis_carterae.AAC.1